MDEAGTITIALPIENLPALVVGEKIHLVALNQTRSGTIISVQERMGMAWVEIESDLAIPSATPKFSLGERKRTRRR
jgi:hypothetical protein